MKRLRNKTNTVFDMTPLLDVIFIVLMVVMCHQTLDTQETQENLEQMSVELEEAVAENELHETQLLTYENAENIVAYVTLYADYDPVDRKTRHIRLAYNNDIAFEEITISPETEEEGYAVLKANMTDFLSKHSDMPVMLTLNQEKTLYRDQVEIAALLEELSGQFDHLFLTQDKVQ